MSIDLLLPRPLRAIFVDLDGTLADFHSELARLYLLDPAEISEERWAEIGEWGLGVPKADLWPRVQACGASWWSELPKLPWADELWAACQAACRQVVVLSTPAAFAESISGKYDWVRRQLGTSRMLLGSPKEVCSKAGHVLIDDRAGYQRRWEAEGGVMLPLRRPWNRSGYEPAEIIAALRRRAAE